MREEFHFFFHLWNKWCHLWLLVAQCWTQMDDKKTLNFRIFLQNCNLENRLSIKTYKHSKIRNFRQICNLCTMDNVVIVRSYPNHLLTILTQYTKEKGPHAKDSWWKQTCDKRKLKTNVDRWGDGLQVQKMDMVRETQGSGGHGTKVTT